MGIRTVGIRAAENHLGATDRTASAATPCAGTIAAVTSELAASRVRLGRPGRTVRLVVVRGDTHLPARTVPVEVAIPRTADARPTKAATGGPTIGVRRRGRGATGLPVTVVGTTGPVRSDEVGSNAGRAAAIRDRRAVRAPIAPARRSAAGPATGAGPAARPPVAAAVAGPRRPKAGVAPQAVRRVVLTDHGQAIAATAWTDLYGARTTGVQGVTVAAATSAAVTATGAVTTEAGTTGEVTVGAAATATVARTTDVPRRVPTATDLPTGTSDVPARTGPRATDPMSGVTAGPDPMRTPTAARTEQAPSGLPTGAATAAPDDRPTHVARTGRVTTIGVATTGTRTIGAEAPRPVSGGRRVHAGRTGGDPAGPTTVDPPPAPVATATGGPRARIGVRRTGASAVVVANVPTVVPRRA